MKSSGLSLLVVLACSLASFGSVGTQRSAYGQGVKQPYDSPDADWRKPDDANQESIAPTGSDRLFVVDSDTYMDRYLFRTDVPNGKLEFKIPLKRFFFHPNDRKVVFDANGFLTPDAVKHLVDNKVLPEKVRLRMRVYDVDEDAPVCPEVDRVFVNDRQVRLNNAPIKLSGANETWSEPSFEVSVGDLLFPKAKGDNGNPPTPADNKISILIDELGCTAANGNPAWAVEVDWGVLEFPDNLPRPTVFMHGWTGDLTAFGTFNNQFFAVDGLPAANPKTYDEGITPIAVEAASLKAEIDNVIKEFGTDKVILIAHSKGGLVSRAAIDLGAKVEKLVTFGTPHHGIGSIQGAEFTLEKVCKSKYPSDVTRRANCLSSAVNELTEDAVRNFNYSGCEWKWLALPPGWRGCVVNHGQRAGTTYFTIASDWDLATGSIETSTYPWRADAIPYPKTANVDRVMDCSSAFTNCHSEVKDTQASYCAALKLLLSNSKTGLCPSNLLTTNQTKDQAKLTTDTRPISPDDSYATTRQASVELPASASAIITASIYSTDQALFSIWASTPPTQFLLEDPSGNVFSASVGAVSYMTATADVAGIWHQYVVSAPVAGVWKMHLTSAAALSAAALVSVKSNLDLSVHLSRAAYPLTTPITVEVALHDGTSPVPLNSLEGRQVQPDGTITSLTLVDNGTNGDLAANDNIFTALFNSGTLIGSHSLAFTATQGQQLRVTNAQYFVAETTAQIQSGGSAAVLDTNGNGLYDQLNVLVPLNILKAGHFEVRGSLVDLSGNAIAYAAYSSRVAGNELPVGVQAVSLSFSGGAIQQRGVNGPYKLTNVQVYSSNSNATAQIAAADNVLQTSAYSADQFEGLLYVLTSITDTAVDNNQNNRFDELQIKLAVMPRQSGAFNLNARLTDANGNEIAWSATTFVATANISSEVTLPFVGSDVGKRRVDGPYLVRDLSIFSGNGSNYAFFDAPYTTQAYRFTQFEQGWADQSFLPIVTNSGQTILAIADAYEPDDSYTFAKPILNRVPQTRSIAPARDVDWAQFTATVKSSIVLETIGPSGDTQLWLANSSRNTLAYDDDSGINGFSRIERTCANTPVVPGTYYVVVNEYNTSSVIPRYALSMTLTACP
jgi:pimeloyl-ACP methyl ester carboxylesterase